MTDTTSPDQTAPSTDTGTLKATMLPPTISAEDARQKMYQDALNKYNEGLKNVVDTYNKEIKFADETYKRPAPIKQKVTAEDIEAFTKWGSLFERKDNTPSWFAWVASLARKK